MANALLYLFGQVFILDPSKGSSRDLLAFANTFYTHKAPTRIGLALAVNPDPEVKGRSDAGVAMLEAFNWVSQNKDAYQALKFLLDVC